MIEWTTGALSGRVSCPDPESLGRVEVAVLAAEDQRCHAPQRCALASPPELPVAIVLAHKTFGRAERSWSSGQTLAATSSIALGQLTRLDALVPPMFRLVISNVPGPPALEVPGRGQARIALPDLPAHAGRGTQHPVVSVDGVMNFGFVDTLPHLQRLSTHLDSAMNELLQITIRHATRRPGVVPIRRRHSPRSR